MSEMVERVAKAMQLGIMVNPPDDRSKAWTGLSDSARESFETMARAAIATMREPTEAMLSASTPALAEVAAAIQVALVDGYKLPKNPYGAPLQRAWRAMIDAALTVPGKP